MNIQQVKLASLNAKYEREVITNELLKGTLVVWSDVMFVLGEKIVAARNKIMSLPAMYADRLTREEVESFRKAIHLALMEAAKVGSEDVRLQNKKLAKYAKASSEVELQAKGTGTVLENTKYRNKPR